MIGKNLKFLNKRPNILGHDLRDCTHASIVAYVVFFLTGSHLLTLIAGFGYILIKSQLDRVLPKNTIYFALMRKRNLNTFLFLKRLRDENEH